MKRGIVIVGAALVLSVQTASELSAQLWAGRGPDDAVAGVALHAGALLPTSELPDGASYKSGAALGASGTLWALRHLGVRAHVSSSFNEGVQGGDNFSSAAAHAGRVYLYSAELAFQYPMNDGRVVPYASAGPGGKSWRWEIDRPHPGRTAFAWSYSGGVDFQPSPALPFGMILDARYHRSAYHWHGLAQTGPCCDFKSVGTLSENPPVINDFVITLGVSRRW